MIDSLDFECGCCVSQEKAAVIVDFCKTHKALKYPLQRARKLITKLIEGKKKEVVRVR